jgi:hypothetical protein
MASSATAAAFWRSARWTSVIAIFLSVPVMMRPAGCWSRARWRGDDSGADLPLVHRFPENQAAVGSKEVSRQLNAMLQADPLRGAYLAKTALDGIERSNACRATCFEVWDTGIGIPVDTTTEIFEEFKQLGDQASNNGSGLGLAIVARAAALLGLDISLRSRPGRGWVFAIELPLGLAVGDDRLADGKTGIELIAALRAHFGADLPAILLTGDTDPKLLRSMNQPGIGVLHKPVELPGLQTWLEEVLADRSPTGRIGQISPQTRLAAG